VPGVVPGLNVYWNIGEQGLCKRGFCWMLSLGLTHLLEHCLLYYLLVLHSFMVAFNWSIFNDFFHNLLGDVLNIVLNSIVVSHLLGDRQLHLSPDLLIFGDNCFYRVVLNS
jgi:hypothetical protein